MNVRHRLGCLGSLMRRCGKPDGHKQSHDIRLFSDWHLCDTVFLFFSLIAAIGFVVVSPESGLFYRADMPYFHAVERAVREAIRHGQFPLWNLYYAEPLFANPQSMVLYPIHVLLRAVPIDRVLAVDVWFHIWLTAVAVYLLLRDFGLSRIASAGAAVSIGFSTMVTVKAVVGGISQIPVFPWALLCAMCYSWYLKYGSMWQLYLTVALTTLVIVSGHTQYSLIGLMIPGSCLVFEILLCRSLRRSLIMLFRTACVGAMSFGILAVQLFPTMEYFAQTTRVDGFSLETSAVFALDPAGFLSVVTPFLPMELGHRVWAYQEMTMYSTLMAVGWVAIALRSPIRKHVRFARYLLVVSLLTIALSMGTVTPLYELLYKLLPFFRAPGRYLMLWSYCLACFTGIGFECLANARWPGQLRSLMVFVVLVVVEVIVLVMFWRGDASGQSGLSQLTFYFSWIPVVLWCCALFLGTRNIPKRTWLLFVVAIAASDAWLSSLYITVWPALSDTCESYVDDYRHYSAYESLADAVQPSEVRLRAVRPTIEQRLPASFGIPAIEDYSANLAYVRDLMKLGDKGMRIMASSYQIVADDISLEGLEPVASAGGLTVYRLLDTMPRAYAVRTLEFVSDDRFSSLSRIAESDFDPSVSAVVSLPSDVQRPDFSSDGAISNCEVDITKYTPGEIVLDVDFSHEALLVLAEPYYPGWQATLDGSRVDILRVNHALRGIIVPQGIHRVRMVFVSRSFIFGCGVTLVTLVLAFIVPYVICRRRRQDVG
jgi:hypothetical protein